MTRFLITMHMPNASGGALVHQITGDHPAENIQEFCNELNDKAFIVIRQQFFMTNKETGEKTGWQDRGDLLLNTQHIGKASIFFEGQTHTEDAPRYKRRENNFRDDFRGNFRDDYRDDYRGDRRNGYNSRY